jgi:hypothetical protein
MVEVKLWEVHQGVLGHLGVGVLHQIVAMLLLLLLLIQLVAAAAAATMQELVVPIV